MLAGSTVSMPRAPSKICSNVVPVSLTISFMRRNRRCSPATRNALTTISRPSGHRPVSSLAGGLHPWAAANALSVCTSQSMKVPSVPARTQSTHLVSFCGTVRGVTKPQHEETNNNQKRHDAYTYASAVFSHNQFTRASTRRIQETYPNHQPLPHLCTCKEHGYIRCSSGAMPTLLTRL